MKINGTDFNVLRFKGMSYEKFEGIYKNKKVDFPRKETYEKIQAALVGEEKRVAAEKKVADKLQLKADKAAKKSEATGK